MRRTAPPHAARRFAVAVAVAAAVAISGCRPLDRCCDPQDFADPDAPLAPDNGPGIALSFDDAYVDAWYELAPLLAEYDARATFFVTRLDRLDDAQLDELRELDALGHEIGCHGHRHIPAGATERDRGAAAWFDSDVAPALATHAAVGLPATSFSFPFGEHTDDTGAIALEHFDHVRGSTFIGPLPEVRDVDAVFLPADELRRRPFSCAFAIDARYGITEERLTRALERALERGEVLALYGHQPAADADDGFRTDLDLLRHVLAFVADHGMRTYLYREFDD